MGKWCDRGGKWCNWGGKWCNGEENVQSGKNETCDSRPGAPEGPGRKKRHSRRLDAPGGPWRSMHGP